MATSQNGWRVLPAGDGSLHKWIIPGTGRHLVLRDGAAGFLLVYFALWFHHKIERLNEGVWDEWGWAPRPIRGSTTTSNHASGTAIDLNATRHPLGVATNATFTKKQQRKIRRQLWMFFGTLRWGGDYKRRPDAMHFEIDRAAGEVERLARILMKTPRGRKILRVNSGQRKVIKS